MDHERLLGMDTDTTYEAAVRALADEIALRQYKEEARLGVQAELDEINHFATDLILSRDLKLSAAIALGNNKDGHPVYAQVRLDEEGFGVFSFYQGLSMSDEEYRSMGAMTRSVHKLGPSLGRGGLARNNIYGVLVHHENVIKIDSVFDQDTRSTDVVDNVKNKSNLQRDELQKTIEMIKKVLLDEELNPTAEIVYSDLVEQLRGTDAG
jgi:hypothetical protein